MLPSMALSAPPMSSAARPSRTGARWRTAATMLAVVSPVMVGAEAASPQPTSPLSACRRTSTLSARLTSSPAMMTGLIIGRLTAMGSIFVMFTAGRLLRLDAGLGDDLPEHRHFFGHARHMALAVLGLHLEPQFGELPAHLGSAQNGQRLLLEPADDLGRRFRRRQQGRIGLEHEVLVARLHHGRNL